MKIKRGLVLIIILSLLLTACGKSEEVKDDEVLETGEKEEVLEIDNQLEEPKKGDEIAIIKTNHGDIKVRLFRDIAPKAVENFTTHGENGYYDGLIFHRVIEDFMLQTGDPEGTGRGGESIWEEPFEDEFHPNFHNYRGALSMANSGPDTNGSQFFIVQAKEIDEELIKQLEEIGEDGGFSEEVVKAYKELGGTPWLDFKHTVFGQVYEGMDVVDEIAGKEVDSSDKPKEDIIIEKVEISTYK